VPKESEMLVIDSADSIKSIEIKDGKARVGAYAIRFSGPDQKDLQGEFFTAKTHFGSRIGDGADSSANSAWCISAQGTWGTRSGFFLDWGHHHQGRYLRKWAASFYGA